MQNNKMYTKTTVRIILPKAVQFLKKERTLISRCLLYCLEVFSLIEVILTWSIFIYTHTLNFKNILKFQTQFPLLSKNIFCIQFYVCVLLFSYNLKSIRIYFYNSWLSENKIPIQFFLFPFNSSTVLCFKSSIRKTFPDVIFFS